MMLKLNQLAPAGAVVIVIILLLFAAAVILLFAVYARYRTLQRDVDGRTGGKSAFLRELREDYAAVYRTYGRDTNTPAIISGTVTKRLGGLLFCERFMNSAVSLFVTLGLFGTFLGLSLSVSSLTELISLSSTEEWLSILNSVGGGLVSALSGMGVAFYTSLVGVACSILFTILRSVFNPQVQREKLENALELWLDHTVAPLLHTEAAGDDESRFLLIKEELHEHAAAVEKSLNLAVEGMGQNMREMTASLEQMIEYSKEPIGAFYQTVATFHDNVRDFTEFNHDLRGNIERMDIVCRDLQDAVKRSTRVIQEAADRAATGSKVGDR